MNRLGVVEISGMRRLGRWALALGVLAGCGTSPTKGGDGAAVGGTGGSSGVAYLTKALELRFFPELWSVRTSM